MVPRELGLLLFFWLRMLEPICSYDRACLDRADSHGRTTVLLYCCGTPRVSTLLLHIHLNKTSTKNQIV